jgi:hypothetical protein
VPRSMVLVSTKLLLLLMAVVLTMMAVTAMASV